MKIPAMISRVCLLTRGLLFFVLMLSGLSLRADLTTGTGGWIAKKPAGNYTIYQDPYIPLKNLMNASSLSASAKTAANTFITDLSSSLSYPTLTGYPGRTGGPYDYSWTNAAGNVTISISEAPEPTEMVPVGYLPATAQSLTVVITVIDDVKPTSLTLTPTLSTPTAGITPASSSITLGSTVSFTLTKSNAAISGNMLSGPSLSVTAPSSPTVVTPPLGTSTYTYTVKGTASLNWSSNAPTGTLKLTPPGKIIGGADDIDVTGFFGYTATIPGRWYITQTNSAGSLSAFADVSFNSASASATVTATSPLSIVSFTSVLGIPSPSATITPSPSSGTNPLTTTLSWTTSNVSSFSVTKNGSAWASSGVNKVDSNLPAGRYSYQITGQPQAYSATLSWNVTGAASYRVTGSGYDSGWISSTFVKVGAQGTYLLTSASGPNGSGTTATASVATQNAPGAVTASTTVNVAKALQTVTLSPTSIDVVPYEEVNFSAAGGHTAYVWSGQASGGGVSKSLMAPLQEGDYLVSVQDPGNADWEASNVASATMRVRKATQPTVNLQAVTPQIYASTQTLSYKGGAVGGSPSYAIVRESSRGVATLSGTQLSANSGTGWVELQVTLPGNGIYKAATSPVVRVILVKAPQHLSLSPSLMVAQPGGIANFTASGGNTSYVWGGLASGAGALKSFTAPLIAGDYRVSVQAVEDENFQASVIEQATLRVEVPVQALLTPHQSEKLIEESTSPLRGRSFRRLWQEKGEWCAYLGRDGLQFEVSGRASKETVRLELQARSSAADAEWVLLASGTPANKGIESTLQVSSRVFVLRLGEVAADNPLVPLSFQMGAPLTGLWLFRARAQDVDGRWSDWTAELPVRVQLPLVARSEQLQTLPPVGAQGAWFKASEPKTFEFQVWVP